MLTCWCLTIILFTTFTVSVQGFANVTFLRALSTETNCRWSRSENRLFQYKVFWKIKICIRLLARTFLESLSWRCVSLMSERQSEIHDEAIESLSYHVFLTIWSGNIAVFFQRSNFVWVEKGTDGHATDREEKREWEWSPVAHPSKHEVSPR